MVYLEALLSLDVMFYLLASWDIVQSYRTPVQPIIRHMYNSTSIAMTIPDKDSHELKVAIHHEIIKFSDQNKVSNQQKSE